MKIIHSVNMKITAKTFSLNIFKSDLGLKLVLLAYAFLHIISISNIFEYFYENATI